jgi:hypothetical protein
MAPNAFPSSRLSSLLAFVFLLSVIPAIEAQFALQLERLSNCDETMMGEGLRVRKVGSPPLFLKIYSPVNAQE